MQYVDLSAEHRSQIVRYLDSLADVIEI
jgi:hypothetical protein